MDLGLWGPSYNQVPRESGYYMQPVWQCDFYFGYGFDIIEENALNEKYCIQVLRVLITKADTEIDELEKDLVSLQSELAWAEYEEWSEICCNALKEKIDCLDVSVRNLRNNDKNDVEVHLLMHTEPAERIHEIVKALLRNYWQVKVEKPADVIVLDSSSNSPGQAADLLDKNIKLSNVDSDSMVKEDIKGSSTTTTKNGAILNSSLEHQEKKTNNLETVKLVNTNVEDSSPHPLELATGHSDEKKVSSNLDLKCTVGGGAKECGFSPRDKKMIQNLSLKSVDKGRHNLDMVKIQPADVIGNNSRTDALKHENGHSNKKKKLSTSDSKILSEQVEEHSSIRTDVIIIDASMMPVGKRADLGKIFKPRNNIVKDSSLSAHKRASGRSILMKKSSKSDLKVNRNQGVGEYCTTATGKSNILNSSTDPEGKVNLTKADKPTTLIKNVSPDAWRYATGLNGKRNNSDTRLGAFGREKSGNSDTEQRLCEFAVKASRKRGMKQSKVGPNNKIDSSVSFSKEEGKRKKSPQIVRGGEAGLTDTENSALTSLLELQDSRGKDTTKLQPEEEGKLQLEEFHIAEIAVNDKKSNLNLSLKPKRQKGKRNIEPNSPSVQEPGFPSMEIVLNSSSLSKAKRQQKSGLGSDISSLSESSNRKIAKNLLQPQSEAKEHSAPSDDSQNSVSQLQKKRKKSKGSPTVKTNFSKSHRDPTDYASEVLSITKSSIDDSCTEAVASLPLERIRLENMTMNHLKAIAKQHKLPNLHKLRKDALVEQLANQLGCC